MFASAFSIMFTPSDRGAVRIVFLMVFSLFGAATSSYQIEGHSFGGAGPTHWDSFAATPGNVVRFENGKA